jgi:hypothetical protein
MRHSVAGEAWFSLTLTLFPGEREQPPGGVCLAHTGLAKLVAGLAQSRRTILPLPGYVFYRASRGARDLSRRNAGPADPRWEIAMPFRQPTFLRTQSPRSYRPSRRDGKHIPPRGKGPG